MIIRIDECEICGIINPRLIFNSWIESKVEILEIVEKKTNKVIYIKELQKTKSKAHYVSLNIPLSKDSAFIMVAVSNNSRKIIHSFSSTYVKRIIQKFKPKPYSMILKKEVFNNRNTLDMRISKQYNKWLLTHENFLAIQDYKYQPLISIVMPVYNVPGVYLSKCLDSILQQTYSNFEICIADDCSTNQETIDTLKRYQKLDKRIKVEFRKQNGHISRATNTALSLASGEYIGLMDNDDILVKHALNEVVNVLNENQNIDFIYTDEDKIDLQGQRSDPHFKSDFHLDSLYGGNFICHFSVVKKELIEKVGGFRVGYEGAQDFDLFLRLTNVAKEIKHIPKILYHWRMIPGSTALESSSKNYAGEAGRRALIDYFEKKKLAVNVETVVNTHYFVEYLYDLEPKVGIVIHVSDKNAFTCIGSILSQTQYQNYELILFLDEGINAKEFDQYNQLVNITVFNIEKNNNFASLFNQVYADIDVECFSFVNQNIQVRSENWIDIMVGYALQKNIGIVGCKIINHVKMVIKSGVFFTENANPYSATLPTYHNDYGFYGRLLVPYNYKAVEELCYLVTKDKITEANGFDASFSYPYTAYDMNMKMYKMGYQNIMIPQVIVLLSTDEYYLSNLSANMKFADKWKEQLAREEYYNPNLSVDRVFRLDI